MAQQDGDQVLPLKLVNLNEGLPFIMGDAHGGKGLFATRDLSEGELLFTEPVFSFQLKNFVGAENHPVPYSLCSHCVRFLGPIETQLGLVCEYVGKKLPAEAILKKASSFAPVLPSSVTCKACGCKYCSEKCKDTAWNQYHSLLCVYGDGEDSLSLKEFWGLASQRELFPARLAIIGKLVANTILLMKQQERSLKEATETVMGQFLTVPFTSALKCRSGDPGHGIHVHPQRFSIELCAAPEGSVEKEIFAEYLSEPLRLLSIALKTQISSQDAELLFSEATFNNIAGISLINSREVQLYSPLHSYFEKIQQSPLAFPFLPIIFKIDSTYGGIPRVDISALCNIYSILNHSCDCNTATGVSERDEELKVNQQYARSSLYAKKAIKSGEQLTANYFPAENLKIEERHEILRTHYFFNCDCQNTETTQNPDIKRG